MKKKHAINYRRKKIGKGQKRKSGTTHDTTNPHQTKHMTIKNKDQLIKRMSQYAELQKKIQTNMQDFMPVMNQMIEIVDQIWEAIEKKEETCGCGVPYSRHGNGGSGYCTEQVTRGSVEKKGCFGCHTRPKDNPFHECEKKEVPPLIFPTGKFGWNAEEQSPVEYAGEKIEITPSPRIDYCGACKKEHGHDCPLDEAEEHTPELPEEMNRLDDCYNFVDKHKSKINQIIRYLHYKENKEMKSSQHTP